MVKYDLDLLIEIIERDSCIIDNVPEKINRETRFDFKCNCGKENNKTFRCIYKNLANCNDCGLILANQKSKKTFLKNYGVDNPFKSQEVKDKHKKTILEKYGVENVFQSQAIKDKSKNTIIEKYFTLTII